MAGTASSPAEVTIRAASREDAQALGPLCEQLGYPSAPADVARRLERILADPLQAVYLAETSGRQVVGWIHIFAHVTVESDPCAELGGLVVADGHRSRGVGERLLAQAEEWARGRGYGRMTVRSNVLRTRAHRFYERLGYRSHKSQRVFTKELLPSQSTQRL
jgi:GNAT superfamily N-acetyltransferase